MGRDRVRMITLNERKRETEGPRARRIYTLGRGGGLKEGAGRCKVWGEKDTL